MESPPRHPVAGIDYPRTFQEFDAWFGSETACREYIRRLRWPDGFVCPHCAAMGEPSEMSRSLLRCRACVSADSLIPFVQAVAVPGSTIHTDGWAAMPACRRWGSIRSP